MSYAMHVQTDRLLSITAYFASGRAEEPMLFHKFLHIVQKFAKKIKQYHAAAGESGVHLVKHSGLYINCVSPVNERNKI
jgi:hypothetical protein